MAVTTAVSGPSSAETPFRAARKLMALQRDEDGVLRAEFGCIGARRQPDRAPAHAEAVRAYGVEMRPARHDRDIRARARQRNREVAAYGARAVNRNPHEVPFLLRTGLRPAGAFLQPGRAGVAVKWGT